MMIPFALCRSVGSSNLTLGSNQRMEFLGDTVLQLITSEYLYKHFPEHHEGHLSLLRSSIVNNRTQAVVCDDIGIPEFAAVANPNRKNVDLKVIFLVKGWVTCFVFLTLY